MKPPRFLFSSLLFLVGLLGFPEVGSAQPLPPGPVNPQAPTLAPVQPFGARRGTTIDLTLTGTNLANPVRVLTSFPAKVTIPADAGNGKNPKSLKIKLEIPKDAPLGYHSLRLATSKGMSNPRLFCIDDLPQVISAGTNKKLQTARVVPIPTVVIGRLDNEQTDYYKFAVKAGQRVSFEVIGRRLGSVFDPEITLLDASGREIPAGYSNDSPGLQTDARFTHTFKMAGDYFVTIRDVAYKGGADFFYRLRIGDFPCATTPLPLAVKRGSKTSVSFAGTALQGVAPVEVVAPTDPTIEAIQVAPRGANGLFGWPVMLALSDLDETREMEPNNEPAKANRIPVPGAVTGRFETREDTDCYVIKLAKGKRYTIEAITSEHLTPTEVVMTLRNAKGTQLQTTNPANPPRFDYSATEDGDYTLVVEHLHSWGGPDEVYRVTVTPSEPSFSLNLNIDRFDAPPGGSFSIPIFLVRNGYKGAIDVTPLGKGLTGKLTIPAGSAKPANQPSGVLTVKVADDMAPEPIIFSVVGKATIDGKAVVLPASTRSLLAASMGNLPVPPRTLFTSLGLAITAKPPFGLVAKFDMPQVKPGTKVTLTVTATRTPGFTGDIALTFAGLPAGVKAAPAKIAAGQTVLNTTLTIPGGAKPSTSLVAVRGTAKQGGQDFAGGAPPVPLVIKK